MRALLKYVFMLSNQLFNDQNERVLSICMFPCEYLQKIRIKINTIFHFDLFTKKKCELCNFTLYYHKVHNETKNNNEVTIAIKIKNLYKLLYYLFRSML